MNRFVDYTFPVETGGEKATLDLVTRAICATQNTDSNETVYYARSRVSERNKYHASARDNQLLGAVTPLFCNRDQNGAQNRRFFNRPTKPDITSDKNIIYG